MPNTVYTIDNESGESLVEQQCKGMGSMWSWSEWVADIFETKEEAEKIAAQVGGIVTPLQQ